MYTIPEIPRPYVKNYEPRVFRVYSSLNEHVGDIRQSTYETPFHYVQREVEGRIPYHGVVIMREIVEMLEKANRLLRENER